MGGQIKLGRPHEIHRQGQDFLNWGDAIPLSLFKMIILLILLYIFVGFLSQNNRKPHHCFGAVVSFKIQLVGFPGARHCFQL